MGLQELAISCARGLGSEDNILRRIESIGAFDSHRRTILQSVGLHFMAIPLHALPVETIATQGHVGVLYGNYFNLN